MKIVIELNDETGRVLFLARTDPAVPFKQRASTHVSYVARQMINAAELAGAESQEIAERRAMEGEVC